jgi:hypothetical protein
VGTPRRFFAGRAVSHGGPPVSVCPAEIIEWPSEQCAFPALLANSAGAFFGRAQALDGTWELLAVVSVRTIFGEAFVRRIRRIEYPAPPRTLHGRRCRRPGSSGRRHAALVTFAADLSSSVAQALTPVRKRVCPRSFPVARPRTADRPASVVVPELVRFLPHCSRDTSGRHGVPCAQEHF